MEQKPVASFVIPAYNAEKYIRESLDSIIRQTIDNWECIVVNDGSTDQTLSIIEQYVSTDSRFSCITIPNSGSGSIPREKGVSLAKSDWIVYMDADDYIDPSHLEKVLSRARETRADIVYVRMIFFSDSKIICTIPAPDFDIQQVIQGKDALLLTIPNWKIGAAGALIKRSVWDSRSILIRDAEYLKVNLDEYHTRELLLLSGKIAFADTNYYYRQHAEAGSSKVSIKLFYNTIVRDKMIENLIIQHCGTDSIQLQAIRQRRINNLINRTLFLYKFGKQLSEEDRIKAWQIIRKYYVDLDKKYLFKNNSVKRVLYTKGYILFHTGIYLRYLLSVTKSVITDKK